MDDELSSVFCNFRSPKHEEGDLKWLQKAIKNMKEALGGNRRDIEGRLDRALRPIALKARTKKSNSGNRKR